MAGFMALSDVSTAPEVRRINPEEAPSRIVSLAPSVTEILFAIGLDKEVVGVTMFCDHPRAALDRPKVGGFKGKSMEAIVALSPDLVIGTGDGNEGSILRSLKRLQVPVLTVQPSTLQEVTESVRTIGRTAGRQRQADELADRMERAVSQVHEKVEGAGKPRVMFVYGRDPLVLAGPGTFAHDMILVAGGDNIASDASHPYPRFSMEAVVSRAPEVIVEGAMGSESVRSRAKQVKEYWSRWGSLPAVKDGRVEVIDEDLIARPGPRIIKGLEKLARALHPERFDREGF